MRSLIPLNRTMSAPDHVALGERAHVAMNAPVALAHYEAALKVDSMNYDALVKAAREAGCDLVLPRSKFVEELATALPKWMQKTAL